MSIQFNIDHANRLVHAVADGMVSLEDMESYLDSVVVEGAMPYKKLWDCRKVVYRYNDDDMMALGARISAYAQMDARGPVAIIALSDEAVDASARFMNLGGAKRPAKIFNSEAKARRWLDEHAEG